MKHFAAAVIAVMLTACDRTPPLPPELPRADAELMQDIAPLTLLPERGPVSMGTLYKNYAQNMGQCVVDRRRYGDLQGYVRGLTK